MAEQITARFGTRVRECREVRQLSQEALADLCGLDRTYVSGIERGRRNPSLKAVAALATGLRMTLAELLEGV